VSGSLSLPIVELHLLSRDACLHLNNKPAIILTVYRSLVYFEHNAEVAEQADAHDSKSCSLGSVGSIPTFGIRLIELLNPPLDIIIDIAHRS
jgi:hypothetical protein